MELSNEILSDITVYMKYAKYIPDLQRRETWEEIVDRNKNMHLKKYPQLKEEIENVYKLVYDKKVLPSMRSMQFAGKPIEISPNRIYNCAYTPIDDWRAFSETMFLLLGGCFEENTEIKTKDGIKKIKDVTTDDYVLTYDDTNDVYRWVQPIFAGETPTASKQKIELTLENGKVIQCTADHKFFTNNRGWVEAQNLTDDDDIKVFDYAKLEPINV
jgi:major membrane immunogen (membrane-anchored lipoprotein)